jgi:copper chaperone CopZ
MWTTTYAVSGMTCSHCVSAVTDEIGKLGGVTGVSIDLVPNGQSRVTVTSEAPLSETDVRDAVDEAGYELVGVSAGASG